ncbi:MAG: DUF4105 domain-containing protein [Deltaproteobacteria bacterium]|nr:DUF4105 domain-containing protein [Deltaproteobacteria bacterium]
MTMGPGDHLYTRGGHAALTVVEHLPDGSARDAVYNYGDTDWQDPDLVWNFLRGKLIFFVSSSGGVRETVGLYGIQQNRSIYHQRLALSDAQARDLAKRLEQAVLPANRSYVYHHLERICTTKARDLIDEVVGGAIRAQLSPRPFDRSIRQLGHEGFEGHDLEGVAADLFIGRLHDRPIDLHYATFLPEVLRQAMQEVRVPDPAGTGKRVPLAGPPELIRKRYGAPAVSGLFTASYWVGGIAVAAVVLLGLLALLLAPARVRLAGLWLVAWSLPASVIGTLILLFMWFSDVPEFGSNELVLVYAPLDWILLALGLRLLRGRGWAGAFFRLYVWLRVLGVLALLCGRVFGLAFQEPFLLALPGIFGVAILLGTLRRLPREKPYDGRLIGLA